MICFRIGAQPADTAARYSRFCTGGIARAGFSVGGCEAVAPVVWSDCCLEAVDSAATAGLAAGFAATLGAGGFAADGARAGACGALALSRGA